MNAVRGAARRGVVRVLNVMWIVQLVNAVMPSVVGACVRKVTVGCVEFVVGRTVRHVVRMLAVCRLNVRSSRVVNSYFVD